MWLNVQAISLITFREGLRLKIVQAIFLLVALFSAMNIFVVTLFSWDLGKVAVEFGLSASALTTLILLFYLSMTLFAEDLVNHNIYLSMARPVKFWHYIAGKYAGLAALLFLVIAIFAVGSAISVKIIIFYFPGFIPPDFSWLYLMAAFLFQWLSMLVVLAVTLFWFSFAQQPFVALVLSIMSYLIGQNLELLRHIIVLGGEDGLSPKQLISTMVTWIFPNLSFFDLKFIAAYGLAVGMQKYICVMLYGFTSIVMFLALASFFFKRKELS